MSLVTVSIFTPTEIATLERLYPDREAFFEFFYLLSDRVQEENEDWADGIRFLCQIKQRPHKGKGNSWLKTASYLAATLKDDQFSNYNPEEVGADAIFEGGVEKPLIDFLNRWERLFPPVRERLKREWNYNG